MNKMIKNVLDTLKISIEYFKENFDNDKFDITTNFAEYELKSSLEILENYLEKVENIKGNLNCPQCELVEVLKNESRERYVMIERLVEKYKNLKVEYEELAKDELCFEKRCEKLEKFIDFLKLNFDISLDSKLRISDGSECVQTFIIDLPKNTTIDEMFEIIEEVLE